MSATSAPYVPDDDATVIEELPSERVGNMLRAFKETTSRQIDRDPMVAVTIARRFIERARSEADPRLLGYAQGVLAPWWDRGQAPPDVILLRATLKQSFHQFEPALSDLDQILRLEPNNPQAWLTRAMVLRTQGRYRDASRACEMLNASAPGFAATLCALAVSSLSGGLEAALSEMDRLQDSTGEQDPSIRTWFDVEHAEMLERAGKRELARARYTEGLKRAPRDLGLIAGYADFLLDDGLYLEAERLTEPWRRVDAVRLRYALARKGQGKENVLDVKMLSESFEAARRRGEELHLREEARFVLDVLGRPAEALALAQKNWAVQREPSDIRLVLTAAQRACSPRAAFPALEWLKEAKMEDARLPKPTASAP